MSALLRTSAVPDSGLDGGGRFGDPERNRDRLKSALGVAAFHAAIGYALIAGLGFDVVREISEELKLVRIAEEPPPPPEAVPDEPQAELQKERAKDPEGAASPANLRDTPTPVVAPPPVIPVPTPLPAAPIAGEGSRPAAGAADVPGPGTGSGGIGTGTGSGLQGNGTGGGGGGGAARRARHIAGGIDDRDYPDAAVRALASGTVHLRFRVSAEGRVTDCAVTRSSGHRALDETTCRLIKRRFRYRPATDSSGRPVPDTIVGQHEWEISHRQTVIEEIVEEEPFD